MQFLPGRYQTQQPNRGQAATAPRSQVPPVSKAGIPSRHTHKHTCVRPQIHTYMQPATHMTRGDMLNTHANEMASSSFPLWLRRMEVFQWEYTYKVDPPSSWIQTFHWHSDGPWVPVPPAASTWTYELHPPADLSLRVARDPVVPLTAETPLL